MSKSPGPWRSSGNLVYAPTESSPVATVRRPEDVPTVRAAPIMLEVLKDVVLALGTVGEVTDAQFQRIKDAITEADGWGPPRLIKAEIKVTLEDGSTMPASYKVPSSLFTFEAPPTRRSTE